MAIEMQSPRALSAKFKGDFAYPTVKDRLPVILTRAIDTVYRQKTEVNEKCGQNGIEELKTLVGRLSKLRNEVQTNKPLLPLEDSRTDTLLWNTSLQGEEEREEGNGEKAGWFTSPWLYTECYFYRRIMEAIHLSGELSWMDPFMAQKQNALLSSMPATEILLTYMHNVTEAYTCQIPALETLFKQFFKVSLWGNKCDLSISAGQENTQTTDPMDQLQDLDQYILQDDSAAVWCHLINASAVTAGQAQLHIVLDNAGFELITDLCLAEFLTATKVVKSVHFHGKTLPWFVSDVTEEDWRWTMEQLAVSSNETLVKLATRWQQYLVDGTWTYQAHDFWCSPYDFAQMNTIAPDLYATLSQADLTIFKGDLNYRKLTGDLKWDFTVPFSQALRGFAPSTLCALRTLKCDLAVGLREGQAESAQQTKHDWMLNGSYAVIQMSKKE